MNNEPIAEITTNELIIQVVKNGSDVSADFPYRTNQHVEREENFEIVINLDDWSGLTTDQEKFLNTNDDVLEYDVWSTVS